MEIGETSGPGPSEKPQLGAVKVQVISKGRGRNIDQVLVKLTMDRFGHTGSDGTVEFKNVRPDTHDIVISRRYPNEDYFTFVIHYPAVKVAHEALGLGNEVVEVAPGATASTTIKTDFYRTLPGVLIRRNHIIWRPSGDEDKYGHWWLIIDGESYGWWPKYPVGSDENAGPAPEPPAPLPPGASAAAKVQYKFAQMAFKARDRLFRIGQNSVVQTLRGVQGELNGVTSFRGKPTRDPHDLAGDAGHESYEVIVTDEEDDAKIKQALRRFARSYSGSWSWRFEFGQNCHTFQVGMLRAAELRRFRPY